MRWSVLTQFIRFAIVGLVSNLVLFGSYSLLTLGGFGHKLAMTLLYGVGILQTFYFNRRWSFRHTEAPRQPFMRYLMLYLAAWILNWIVLAYLVDGVGLSHFWVQGVMIVLIGVLMFYIQRSLVFRNTGGPTIASDGVK